MQTVSRGANPFRKNVTHMKMLKKNLKIRNSGSYAGSSNQFDGDSEMRCAKLLRLPVCAYAVMICEISRQSLSLTNLVTYTDWLLLYFNGKFHNIL